MSRTSKKRWADVTSGARWVRWMATTVLGTCVVGAALGGCGRNETAKRTVVEGIEGIETISQALEISIPITSATSGTQQAANPRTNAFDGNDTTTRFSVDSDPPGGTLNPLLQNSWIDLNHARQFVTKVRVKFYNGATRTYPLKIEVDGTQVWAGTTSLNAGFWEVSFPPTLGDNVKISMTGANSNGTNWFSIWEVQIKGNTDCVDSNGCDDGNPCTTDTCNGGACAHSNNTVACDDNNPCTAQDQCNVGSCLGTTTVCAGYTPPTTDRSKTALNGTWKFIGSNTLTGAQGTAGTGAYNDITWSTVNIPHTWDRSYSLPANTDDATGNNVTQYSAAWYRTSFTLSSADVNKRIYLAFDGVSQIADVYINGNFVEQHRGAYTGFTIDANNAGLNFSGAPNYVAVKVDNTAACDDCLPDGVPRLWKGYGGIYRKAYLLKVNQGRVDTRMYGSSGVFFTPQNVTVTAGSCTSPTTLKGSAQLRVVTALKSNYTPARQFNVKHTLVDPSQGNTVIATMTTPSTVDGLSSVFQLSPTITNLSLWHVGSPKLYDVYTEVIDAGSSTTVDVVKSTIGFRSYSLGTNTFTLNGCNVPLRGVSKHQENELSATAMSDAELTADWDGMQDLGANYVRLPHYPHSQFEYDLADQRGMMVWAENGHTGVAGAYLTKPKNFETTNREMVYQLFNHPSIILWSSGNEAKDNTGARATDFAKIIKTADRVAQGVDSNPNSTAPSSRPTAYAFGDQNVTMPVVDKPSYNIYMGWYGGPMWNFTTDAPAKHSISESGAGMVISQHTDNMHSTAFTVNSSEPEEYGALVNEVKYQTIFVNSPGSIPLFSNWAYKDFSDKKYGGRWNTKGLLNFAGVKKDTYYHFQSFLKKQTYAPYLPATTPVMHINGCHYFKRGGQAGDDKAIKVYSNAANVWLKVNGVLKNGGNPKANGSYTHASIAGSNGMVINNAFYFSQVLSAGRNDVQACDSSGCSGTGGGANTDSCTIYWSPTSYSSEPVVTNLTSSSNQSYFLAVQPKDGWPVYWGWGANDNNTYDVLPSILSSGLDGFIATRNQGMPGFNTSMSFTVNVIAPATSVTVYVMFTPGTNPVVPAWITNAGFTNTGVTANWHGNSTKLWPAQIYSKTYTSTSTVSFTSMTTGDAVVLIKDNGSGGGGGGTIANGTYEIKNVNSGKSLDVIGASTADGANVQQWGYGGLNSEKFTVTDVGGGQYSIIAVHSGKGLDVTGVGGNPNTADGANVQQWGYGGGTNQKFTIVDTGGGQYQIKPVHSGKCVEVSGFGLNDGDNIQQWTCTGTTSQKFTFIPR